MAQPGSVSRGFGGRALWVLETTEGTTPTDPAYVKFSDHVQSVSVSIDPQREEWRDIGDYDVQSFVDGLPIYGVRIEYLLHVDRFDPVDAAIDRNADNSLDSYSIEISANRDDSTVGYYTIAGCKPEQISVRGEVGRPTVVEITYRALSMTRSTTEPSIGVGSRETAALGALSVFSSSTITKGGSALAYLTRSAEFQVSHALSVEGDDSQSDPKIILEGARSVSGRADITVDDGGTALADAVANGTESDVVFALGSSGAPKYTLTNAQFNNFEMNLGAEDGFVMENMPFTAKGATTGTVA